MASLESQIASIVNGMNLTTAQINQLTANIVALRSQSLLELDSDVAKLKDGSHLTKDGFDLLAKAVAGKQLVYSKILFGDSMRNGQLVETTRKEEYNFTSLINAKNFELPLVDYQFTGGGTACVKCRVQNANLTEGFYFREFGLFAYDPDTGEEKLYCYRNTGVLSEYIPGGDSDTVWDVIFAVVTVVDEATNVTAIIDGNLAFVTQTEFVNHLNSTNPHPNAPSLKSDVATTTMFWVTSNDSHLHRINLADARRVILGGDAALLPQMERRITQTEINVANLFMQLNSETELGLKPNLLLVDDFTEYGGCDQFVCNITGEVAGYPGVQVDDDADILVGHWYTITDGTRSEYVRVNSVAKNDGFIYVGFESALTNTYTLARTRLMRSTVMFEENKVLGAGEIRTVTTYKKNDIGVFTGTGANTLTTLTLNTTQNNSSSFELSGQYGFTSNGEFTISA